MKRKIAIVIAVLLCVVLVFTFVACKKKVTEPENNKTGEETKEEKVVSAEDQATMKANIETYLESWLTSHAEAVGEISDQSIGLKTDLGAQSFNYLLNRKPIRPTITVTFNEEKAEYTVKVEWKDQPTITLTGKAVSVKYAEWSGPKLADYERFEDVGDALDKVIKAGINTANLVTGNAPTGKFAVDTVVGVNVTGHSYGLHVKGNVDLKTNANTELALTLINTETNRDLVGIYYKGAKAAKDCKIYLQYSVEKEENKYEDKYYYLDYADFSSLFAKIPSADKSDGVLSDYKNKGLEAFVPEEYSSIVGNVIGMVVDGYQNDDGDYLFDINLGSVMAQLSSILATTGVNVDEYIPDFITDLGIDVNTMSGLQGHISIAVGLSAKEDLVESVEVSVNIPECTFNFNDKASDTEKAKFDKFGITVYDNKVDLPAMGFSLYVDDFQFLTNKKVTDVIPTEMTRKAVKFSPCNFNLSGDVYVEESADEIGDTYHFEFLTDINPLEIWQLKDKSTASAVLRVRQTKKSKTFNEADCSNFLTITYQQGKKFLTVSGTAFGLKDEGNTLYTFDMNNKSKDQILNEILVWLGLGKDEKGNKSYIGLDFDEKKGIVIDPSKGEAKEGAKVVFGDSLVQAIMEYAMSKNFTKWLADKAASNTTPVAKAGEDVVVEVAEGSTDTNQSAMDLIKGAAGDLKKFYDKLVEDKVIEIDTSVPSVKVAVTDAVINEATQFINDHFIKGADNKLKTDIKDPSAVNVEYNTKTYTKKVYVDVTYDEITYALTVDWSTDNTFVITFSMKLKSNRTYVTTFTAQDKIETTDSTKWKASISYQVIDAKGKGDKPTTIELANYHGKWGEETKTEIDKIIAEEMKKTTTAPIFNANAPCPATQLAKGILEILNDTGVDEKGNPRPNRVRPVAEDFIKFVIRQITKKYN